MNLKTLGLGLLIASAGAAASAAPAATVSDIFTRDMLGKNRAYFESLVGPAQQTIGKENSYRVSNCRVTATYDNGKVATLKLDLDKSCHIDPSNFIDDYAPPATPPLTPAQFDDVPRYSADCLTGCGNAADPSAFALVSAQRYQGAVQVQLEFVLAGGPAMDAAEKWERAMKKEVGAAYIEKRKFNCDGKFNRVAVDAFKDVPASAITIGYEIAAQTCD